MLYTFALTACLLVWFLKRHGIISYGFLFTTSLILYLLLIPFVIDGYDEVTGANATARDSFYTASLLYLIFYLLGVRMFTPFKCTYQAFHNREYTISLAQKIIRILFLILSLLFISYSILTRNIFAGDDFLFTILGFDFLLIYYLLTRNKRNTKQNSLFFFSLILLFLYAGFRYRIAILVFAELLPLLIGNRSTSRKILAFTLGLFVVMILGVFAQFRTYGSLDVSSIQSANLSPLLSLTQSGEQTVSLSTMAVVDNIQSIPKIGMEPFTVTLTHFIPSAIWPDKPRANYLEAYFDVSEELRNTGTAMHDLAQATLMFGINGLPFTAFAFGMISGFLFRSAVHRSPNNQFTVACLILFAVLIPTRGYLAQQITWALTFVVPAILFRQGCQRLSRS